MSNKPSAKRRKLCKRYYGTQINVMACWVTQTRLSAYFKAIRSGMDPDDRFLRNSEKSFSDLKLYVQWQLGLHLESRKKRDCLDFAIYVFGHKVWSSPASLRALRRTEGINSLTFFAPGTFLMLTSASVLYQYALPRKQVSFHPHAIPIPGKINYTRCALSGWLSGCSGCLGTVRRSQRSQLGVFYFNRSNCVSISLPDQRRTILPKRFLADQICSLNCQI